MKIKIEDYFGNDVLSLNYEQCLVNASDNTIKVIDEISNVHGYSVADVEDDYVRVQCDDVVDDYITNKNVLVELVSKLNKHFL